MDNRYLLPIVTVALFIGSVILQLQGEGWLHLIGWFSYGMAVWLIIMQLLSMVSERSKPSGKPEQSKISQPMEPRSPSDPPRRI